MSKDSALAKAMNGQELSERQAKGALNEAMTKLEREGGRLSKLKENVGELGEQMVYAAEMQGTVFTASFAEGYFGEEKMDVGPVDVRFAGGVLTAGYGLYNVLTGKGGEHALAVGNGLLATSIARVGRNAGKALAEKKDQNKSDKGAAPAPAADQSAPAPGPKPLQVPADTEAQGDFGDLVRDIFLTPDAPPIEGARGREPERHTPSRFIRATVRR